jgi:oxaloacetate decarboxylase beta subunit
MDLNFLIEGVKGIDPKIFAMFVIGGLLIFLAIKKNVEPALLLPMGFGAILVNIPATGVLGTGGIIEWLYTKGIEASEAMPLLLFIGIGAMIDFGPLLSNPKLFFFGAAAQVGIFLTILLGSFIFPTIQEAASVGIIGAADGPTSILVANKLLVLESQKGLRGAIMVVAYSYMALVPIIQPAAIRLVTTKKERMIHMPYEPKSVSKLTKILFPIIVTIIAGLIAAQSVALVGFLMFGNLIRECGVLNNLTETANKTLANLVTLLLGITIAFNLKADAILSWQTLSVIGLGFLAFTFDTIGGVLFAKFLNLFLKKKINPMVGAAGISAFPMSSRVVQKMGQEADSQNHLLMHAVGANVAGQIASVIAGGFILSYFL